MHGEQSAPSNNIYIYIQIKFSFISCIQPVLAVGKIRVFLYVRQSYIAVFVQGPVLSFCWNITGLRANRRQMTERHDWHALHLITRIERCLANVSRR